MNSNQIKKVKELCEKSAEGPWEMGAVFHQNTPDKIEARHIHSAKEWIAYNVSEYNGKFIVEARELLPLAIDALEKAVKTFETIKKTHPDCGCLTAKDTKGAGTFTCSGCLARKFLSKKE